MSTLHRRQFLHASLAGLLATPIANAIDPIRRPAPAQMRLSLAAYSFNRYLQLKGKTPPTMTLEEFIDFAATVKVDAVELTSYYFKQSTPDYIAKIKGKCTLLGLDVSGSAVGNNFCVVDPSALKTEIDNVKKWVDHTSRLGGKSLRIFAGTLGKGQLEENARAQCVKAIEEICDYSANVGVMIALENHGGITASADQLLSIVKAVKSPWFGVNVDTGNFRTADPYGDLAKIAPYAVNVQVKTEIQPMGGAKQPADLAKLINILRDVNYRGYVALEYEAAEDPKTAVAPALDALRKLIA